MTIDKITPELFEKMVDLAALELTEDESVYLLTEMNHQLASLNELSQVPLAPDLQPSLHGIDVKGAGPRADVWTPFPHPEAIVALAPVSEEGMVAVPDVAREAK